MGNWRMWVGRWKETERSGWDTVLDIKNTEMQDFSFTSETDTYTLIFLLTPPLHVLSFDTH